MNIFILTSFVIISTLNMAMSFKFESSDYSSAFRDSRATHVKYGKHPDGTCYRRVTTNDNGNEHVDEQIMDCAEVEREMRAEQERHDRKMAEDQRRVNEQVNKVFQESIATQRKVQEDIKRSLRGGFSSFL